MNIYVVKRLLLFIPTLLLVTIIVFSLMRLIPGDPAYLRLIGTDGDADFTQEQLLALQEQLGTDKPLMQQYVFWVWDMLRGDMGLSMIHDTPIIDDIKSRLPITLELTILSLALATVIAVPLGVISGGDAGFTGGLRLETCGDRWGRHAEFLAGDPDYHRAGERLQLAPALRIRRHMGKIR